MAIKMALRLRRSIRAVCLIKKAICNRARSALSISAAYLPRYSGCFVRNYQTLPRYRSRFLFFRVIIITTREYQINRYILHRASASDGAHMQSLVNGDSGENEGANKETRGPTSEGTERRSRERERKRGEETL